MAIKAPTRYVDISPKAYEHPADRAATAALGSIPLLEMVLKKLSALRFERAYEQILLLADSVRLSEQQLPRVYEQHLQVLNSLDIPTRPELYLSRLPAMNAMTVGSSNPMIILNAGIVSASEAPLQAVLAHEAGHVLSDHVHYATVLAIIQNILRTNMAPIATLPLEAVALVLLEWFRCAELSCDRASALVVEDPLVVCRLLMNLAGGGVAGLDLNAFIAQAEAYADTDDLLARPSRWLTELGRTHPYAVRRVAELTRWVREGDYDRIRSGSYLRRGQEPPPSEQMKAATEHYRQRFSEIVDRVAGGMQKITEQISTWLRGAGHE